MSVKQESAEAIGLRAIGWLAGNDDLLQVFMGSTGASSADFRESVQDVEFQASVLDFLLMSDQWVMEFCDAESLPYDQVMRARAALPGGEQVHWT
ncbi:DUF3572 domain-containing protein [Tropicibacter sp. S64]|uniref:DUF3572 domain-containing protein n=1 Tax=Tropicibacter sp. S64 TaxID=3415122 RepID=UPI003C7B51C5